ncbi:plasmid pRiA4b ORF-3 family protein [Polaribacter aestuariivivens]|uniref:Plasmid pRiA4b ORF-3 family protein n=1 Tax=Polaribacter aestuariivivens TaxID=2304626 RepID=A0A5S3N6V5_9FLAO|nr:plasmid pRiA4b ORF-3 family protein [Polaribacter aestuariivivens]TMM30990.1 plasmid pRiA4b ORF-3 family protein [Polaribacter aestuariivivens]
MYKIRVILDTNEDVIRTILVNDAINLEDLHFTIAKSFGFEGQEMASFYRTDEEWNQGEEIPLFNMAEAGEGLSMKTCALLETLPEENDKLIYVYDFLKMWTFYVDVVQISDEQKDDLPAIILNVGEIPEKAPEKEFIAENPEQLFGDEGDIDDDYGHFDDDFDYTEY